jgi:arginyl-tRNA synthetase
MNKFKDYIEEELIRLTNLPVITLDVPPDQKLGDYAFACFTLAKDFRKAPNVISEELSVKFNKGKLIEKVQPAGPYLNFFINKTEFAKSVITQIRSKKELYGSGKKQKEKVMVEYSQPNTHKAFHVGHLRGTSIGESLSRILRCQGYNVIQANYFGDTGTHVAKWIWCYLKFHKGEKPNFENLEKWIASIYVEAVQKAAESDMKDIYEINAKIEQGKDKDLIKLWKESKQWSLDGFDAIYEDLDAHFDRVFFESEVEARGKEMALDLVKKKIAKVDDGATIIDLKDHNLGVWVLLRKDGSALYSAKDIALAERKFKEFKIDRSIYVLGAAQSMHLQQLFKTLELMKFKQANKCYHLSYLEIRLPEGKMSSRTGQNILYRELKEELLEKLQSEVNERHKDWDDTRKQESVKKVLTAALKFDMLMQDPNRVIVFDIKKALDFQGESGPYIQYTHARINSVLKNAEKMPKSGKFELLTTPEEHRIVYLLSQYPEIVYKAAEQYRPALICRYLLDLCQGFNEFYQNIPILKADAKVRDARLIMLDATRQVISNGLNLLGINAPEEM